MNRDTLEQERDAIDRKLICAFIDGLISDDGEREKGLEYIRNMLPVNPTKTGHWILTSDDDLEYCTCSKCGYQNGENWMIGSQIKFCPNCGDCKDAGGGKLNKWIAEFDLEDGDALPEYMELYYMRTRLDFHCRPMWIPVSERLPKRTGEYFVTVIDDSGEDNFYKAVGVAWFAHKKDYDIKESEWRELRIDEKVIAWMPLPKPYEPQERSDKE